jgi:hypothetical protein
VGVGVNHHDYTRSFPFRVISHACRFCNTYPPLDKINVYHLLHLSLISDNLELKGVFPPGLYKGTIELLKKVPIPFY